MIVKLQPDFCWEKDKMLVVLPNSRSNPIHIYGQMAQVALAETKCSRPGCVRAKESYSKIACMSLRPLICAGLDGALYSTAIHAQY